MRNTIIVQRKYKSYKLMNWDVSEFFGEGEIRAINSFQPVFDRHIHLSSNLNSRTFFYPFVVLALPSVGSHS